MDFISQLKTLDGQKLIRILSLLENRIHHERDDFGEMGIIPVLLDRIEVFSNSTTENPDIIKKVECLICSNLWILCIGHVLNKKRCGITIPQLLKTVQKHLPHLQSDLESQQIIEYATKAIWSVSYGITENIIKVLDLNGVELIIEVMKVKDCPFALAYSASGALWHLGEISRGCEEIIKCGGIDYLVELTKRGKDDCLVPCLALGTIASNAETEIPLEKLKCIDLFLVTKDPLNFPNTFVWTTVKPLTDLLESKYSSVKLLGTFLALVTIISKSTTAALFMEGAVKILKDIALTSEDHTALHNYSITALQKLGITLLKPPPPPPTLQQQIKDISTWLESINLSSFIPKFIEHQITLENIAYITESDLESMGITIGPRKKLAFLIECIKKGHRETEAAGGAALKTIGEEEALCVICFNGKREMCFVKCGHVVACQVCTEILIAKHYPCVICRSEIIMTVKPKYIL